MSIIVRAIYSLASLMASNFSECQFGKGGRLGLECNPRICDNRICRL